MVKNLQSDLTAVATWLASSYYLYLNVDKSDYILIGSCQRVAVSV